jgi:hypothetical protein
MHYIYGANIFLSFTYNQADAIFTLLNMGFLRPNSMWETILSEKHDCSHGNGNFCK